MHYSNHLCSSTLPCYTRFGLKTTPCMKLDIFSFHDHTWHELTFKKRRRRNNQRVVDITNREDEAIEYERMKMSYHLMFRLDTVAVSSHSSDMYTPSPIKWRTHNDVIYHEKNDVHAWKLIAGITWIWKAMALILIMSGKCRISLGQDRYMQRLRDTQSARQRWKCSINIRWSRNLNA